MRSRGDAAAAASGGASLAAMSVPVLTGELGSYDGLNWTTVSVDARVRHNAFRLSSGADGAYLTAKVALEPEGATWGVNLSYAAASDAGKIDVAIGSVASPNPGRGGVDDAGSLDEDDPTYVLVGTVDTYAPVFADVDLGGFVGGAFRLIGAPGDPLTTLSVGADPYTGVRRGDGGPGIYEVRLKMNGKNAASSSFRGRVTALTFWRIDDQGFF